MNGYDNYIDPENNDILSALYQKTSRLVTLLGDILFILTIATPMLSLTNKKS